MNFLVIVLTISLQNAAMDVRYVLQDAVVARDADKEESNLRKHSVSFEEACEVFFDPVYKMIEDDSIDREQRWTFTEYSKANRASS